MGARWNALVELADPGITVDSGHNGRVKDAHMGICHKRCDAFMEGEAAIETVSAARRRGRSQTNGLRSANVMHKLHALRPQRHSLRFRAAAVLLSGAAAGLALLSSCAAPEQAVAVPPHIEGATFVGNAACADCHAHYTRSFAASPHGRFHREDVLGAGQTGCESCHGPGSKHVATAGAREFIVNPGRDPAACFTCHRQTHAEFNLPYRHPVLEGRLNCVDCHDPHGPDLTKPAGGLAMARLNESCAACHREQARPFVFEHEALREGCVTCHQPHGSIAPRLLTQPDANLCLKCHAQVQLPGAVMIGKTDHAQLLRLGSCWSAGCHTAVHGSNIHPKMLY